MNSKERFMAAIEKEGVDRVPTGPPFQGYWALDYLKVNVGKSIEDPKLAALAQIDVTDKCEFDGLETMWDWLAPVEALGCQVSIPDVGNPSTMSHVISGPEILDKMEQPDPEKDYRIKSAMQTTELLIEKLGKEKFLYMTLVCPFTMVGELRGVENLMIDLYDDPEFVKDMLKFSAETLKIYSEHLMSSGVDGIILCDPTASGDLISKEDFDKFSQPYIKDVAKVVKEQNGYVLLHICGNTSDRLESIADIRAEVFSLDFLVDLEHAKNTIGKKQTFLGNVNPAETLFNGTPEDVIEESRSCIQKTGGIGHILGAGCDIAPGTPIENIEAWKNVVQLHL
ncbi:MAG: uroporphyrinogen decarboxylase family protein [Candidatus Methanofastidiosia archaeon]